MAEKKKMSVAEILAAARKADNKQGATAETAAPTAVASAPAEVASAESAPDPVPSDETVVAVESPTPAEKSISKPIKPAAKGERPSVADIMAMARAGKNAAAPAAKPATSAAVKPTPKPAAEKPAAKPAVAKAAAPKPGAGMKDTASILAAARQGARPGPITKAEAAARPAPKEPPAAKVKPVAPPMPAKPSYAKPKPAKAPAAAADDRRGFLGTILGSFLGLGFTALTVTTGLWTLGSARFMFPNVLTEPPSRFKVGFKDAFSPGQVETKFVAQYGVWIVNAEYNGQQQIFALRTVCTHLGCTPNWLEGEQKFKCPCHGSGFYKDGINFEGPAPRPLERYAIAPGNDLQLEVDKSKLFQEELGQWNDPTSFVPA